MPSWLCPEHMCTVTAVSFNLHSRLPSLLPSRVGSAALQLRRPPWTLRVAAPCCPPPRAWGCPGSQLRTPGRGCGSDPSGLCATLLEAFKAPASGERRSSLNPTRGPWGTVIFGASRRDLGGV